jgi:protease I
MPGRLAGRRVAVLAADGFEMVELAMPLAALRAAGADVEIISLRRGSIRGVNLHEPAGRVRVSRPLAEADPADYDALFVPGGFINPDLLRQSARARAWVRAFDDIGKPIATLCHGPWLLVSAGVVQGRRLTSWPGIRDDVVNAGASWLDQPVVRDGTFVTSRGPQDMAPFIRAMVSHFADPTPMSVTGESMPASAPQRDEPPALVLETMRWLPKPSVRTAIGLGVVAAGVFAVLARRGQSSRPLSGAATSAPATQPEEPQPHPEPESTGRLVRAATPIVAPL